MLEDGTVACPDLASVFANLSYWLVGLGLMVLSFLALV